jgi:hypothetical protein
MRQTCGAKRGCRAPRVSPRQKMTTPKDEKPRVDSDAFAQNDETTRRGTRSGDWADSPPQATTTPRSTTQAGRVTARRSTRGSFS